jgi:hypothetical protein
MHCWGFGGRWIHHARHSCLVVFHLPHVDYLVAGGDVAGYVAGYVAGAADAAVVANVPCPCASFRACVVKAFHHHRSLCDRVASAWVVAGVPYCPKRLARADG